MAHNLTMVNGVYRFAAKDSAWHGLGNITGKFMTSEEIRQAAGILWEPFLQQLFNPLTGKPLPDTFGQFRDDTGDMLGRPVTGQFEVATIARGMAFADALMASKDGAHYVTMGEIKGGEKVFFAADLDLTIRVGDDVLTSYLTNILDFSGRACNDHLLSVVRPVCDNTVRAALSENSKHAFRLAHRKGINAKYDTLQAVLVDMAQQNAAIEEKFNFINQKLVSFDNLKTTFLKVFPPEPGEKDFTDARLAKLEKIVELFESNDNDTFKEQRGTAYAAFNAFTNFLGHHDPAKSDDSRFASNLAGDRGKQKEKALEVLVELAGDMPDKTTSRAWMQRYTSTAGKPAPTDDGFASLDDIINATQN